jgi:hypothetical protein
MKRVFFDESGNTGQNLLDPRDPVFVLASCRFEPEQESGLLNHFANRQGPELKFSRLRKTEAGQRAVLALLGSSDVTTSSVAAYVINKPFMVVTKYCDIVLEPSFRRVGLNFYERGMNIALANLLWMAMPVYLAAATWDSFLAGFVRLIRERTPQAFDDFQRAAALIYSYLEFKERDLSHYIAATVELSREVLPMIGEDELDPLVPGYYVLAGHWGKLLGEAFEMVVDRSKVLAKEQPRLMKLASGDLARFEAGHDRRTMEFPLKVDRITAVDSRTEKQVQLADILCGAVARAANSSATPQDGTFENRVFKICFDKGLIIGACWPDKEIDPAKIGTDQTPLPGQIGLAEYTSMIARDDPRTKRIKEPR